MHRHYFLLYTLLFALSSSAANEVNLDTVTVTAPVKTQARLLPLDVTEVTAAEINKSTESSLLPVLVNKVPGLFVSERGFAGYGVSGGAAGTVNIRGVGQGNKVLFMIDGQPQWAGVFGHALPDTYVANGVERVEVVKGPSSLIYGSNAMGGSVNIITRRQAADGFTGRARAMFGSFTTQKFDLSAGYRRGAFSLTAAAQLDRSNGNRRDSQYWLANELVQAQYAFSRNWTAGASIDMTQTVAHNPGTEQEPLLGMMTDVNRQTASLFVKDTYDIAQGGLQFYVNWGRNKVDDGWAPDEEPTDYIFRLRDYNLGMTLFQTFHPWRANDLSVGFDYQRWGGHVWNEPKGELYEGFNHGQFRDHVDELAGYVMMQQGFLENLFSVNAGVRYQHGSNYGSEWVPQAGFIVNPSRTGQFKFSFSKGFRSPNMRELYLYRPANPDLKPEYMLNYEVSYRQWLLDRRMCLDAALFFIDGSDMIQTQMVDGRPLNVNTGSFINKGFELEAAFAINRLWQVSANYSYLYSKSSILYAPMNKLNAEVNYSPGDFRFTLEATNIGGLETGNPDGRENYTLINLRAAYDAPLKTPVTLFVKADNLTSTDYEIVYGCPMPGVTVMGGVEVKF